MLYDVLIVGGGPGGLAAALALGRARKRVLLSDAGPRRNAAASHLHNFVTRDGTPPEEFRRIGREQLAAYPNVEVRDARVESVSGTRGAFLVRLASSEVQARRVLLCTGMVDETLPIEGFSELWGHAIFQCPYCHGWEVQDRRWGVLLDAANVGMLAPFALMLRGWTRSLAVFKAEAFDVPAETSAQLQQAGVRIESAPVRRLIGRGRVLESIELSTGDRVPCDVLFAHPPQRQVDLVRSLGLALDDHGFVRVEAMKGETSIPGIYAAGDLTTRNQAAIIAASASVLAATMINFELNSELAARGAL
jgi:thioredoxin reductase